MNSNGGHNGMEAFNDELKQLREQAPLLFSLRRREPFRLPEAYFDLVENEILNQCLPSDGFVTPEAYFRELEDKVFDRVGLSTNEKKQPEVPPAYFDDLEAQILAQTTEVEENTPVIPIMQRRAFRAFVGLAASVIAIWLISKAVTPAEKCETFACLLEKTELTDEDLLLIYDETVVEDLLGGDANLLETIESDDAMIDYLLDEDIDLEELLNEQEI